MKKFWLWFFGRSGRCGAKLDLDLRLLGRQRIYCERKAGHPGWHRYRDIRWE